MCRVARVYVGHQASPGLSRGQKEEDVANRKALSEVSHPLAANILKEHDRVLRMEQKHPWGVTVKVDRLFVGGCREQGAIVTLRKLFVNDDWKHQIIKCTQAVECVWVV